MRPTPAGHLPGVPQLPDLLWEGPALQTPACQAEQTFPRGRWERPREGATAGPRLLCWESSKVGLATLGGRRFH